MSARAKGVLMREQQEDDARTHRLFAQRERVVAQEKKAREREKVKGDARNRRHQQIKCTTNHTNRTLLLVRAFLCLLKSPLDDCCCCCCFESAAN